jgi:hypothetical protein
MKIKGKFAPIGHGIFVGHGPTQFEAAQADYMICPLEKFLPDLTRGGLSSIAIYRFHTWLNLSIILVLSSITDAQCPGAVHVGLNQ